MSPEEDDARCDAQTKLFMDTDVLCGLMLAGNDEKWFSEYMAMIERKQSCNTSNFSPISSLDDLAMPSVDASAFEQQIRVRNVRGWMVGEGFSLLLRIRHFHPEEQIPAGRGTADSLTKVGTLLDKFYIEMKIGNYGTPEGTSSTRWQKAYKSYWHLSHLWAAHISMTQRLVGDRADKPKASANRGPQWWADFAATAESFRILGLEYGIFDILAARKIENPDDEIPRLRTRPLEEVHLDPLSDDERRTLAEYQSKKSLRKQRLKG
ncbi:hypothetical protein [Caenispirillum bisanense]|uniref:Uncharacterized protein n=1 Tax=Caenispirillum bisanense TaxID=414052 RepID=A0A286GM19_9PROT|nr:hypothetical protein [Caenispirillum bisanense]SOD96542.1 hypothetical protein SAMN05421508_105403 [Caenispirillum bisanense]